MHLKSLRGKLTKDGSERSGKMLGEVLERWFGEVHIGEEIPAMDYDNMNDIYQWSRLSVSEAYMLYVCIFERRLETLHGAVE